MDYWKLVDQVLSVPALAKEIVSLEQKGSALNLIHADWRKRLQNHISYQRFINRRDLYRPPKKSTHCDNQSLQDPERNKLKIIVVANVLISQAFDKTTPDTSFSIYTDESEPLAMAARAMTKDLKGYECIDEYKMFMNTCNPLACNLCMQAKDKFEEAGYDVPIDSPCIRKTAVFDGENVVARFGSNLKKIFKQRFLAIIEVHLGTRSLFKRNCKPVVRVGGNLIRMIAFSQDKLEKVEEVFLGNLASGINQEGTTDEEPSETAEEIDYMEPCQRDGDMQFFESEDVIKAGEGKQLNLFEDQSDPPVKRQKVSDDIVEALPKPEGYIESSEGPAPKIGENTVEKVILFEQQTQNEPTHTKRSELLTEAPKLGEVIDPIKNTTDVIDVAPKIEKSTEQMMCCESDIIEALPSSYKKNRKETKIRVEYSEMKI